MLSNHPGWDIWISGLHREPASQTAETPHPSSYSSISSYKSLHGNHIFTSTLIPKPAPSDHEKAQPLWRIIGEFWWHCPPTHTKLGISHLSDDMCLLSCLLLNWEMVQEGTQQKEVGTWPPHQGTVVKASWSFTYPSRHHRRVFLTLLVYLPRVSETIHKASQTQRWMGITWQQRHQVKWLSATEGTRSPEVLCMTWDLPLHPHSPWPLATKPSKGQKHGTETVGWKSSPFSCV